MKKFLLFLLLTSPAFADDLLRDVQTELKTQGFYYGEVTGQASPETAAAIKRYQIRNGLEVTGQLSTETVASLGIGPAKPVPQVAPPPAPRRPPAPVPATPSVEEKDREFLRREEIREEPMEEEPAIIQPRPSIPEATDEYAEFFAGTPYASAPAEVQQHTVRRAQAILFNRRFYRDTLDGQPGPATEEALLGYQRNQRLPLTGRLDLQTLNNLRLLPSRTAPRAAYEAPRTQPRVYRGIIVE